MNVTFSVFVIGQKISLNRVLRGLTITSNCNKNIFPNYLVIQMLSFYFRAADIRLDYSEVHQIVNGFSNVFSYNIYFSRLMASSHLWSMIF